MNIIKFQSLESHLSRMNQSGPTTRKYGKRSPQKSDPLPIALIKNSVLFVTHFLYFWLNNRLFFPGYFIRRISGTIKRFWCIRYGTNIEVKFGTVPELSGQMEGLVLVHLSASVSH